MLQSPELAGPLVAMRTPVAHGLSPGSSRKLHAYLIMSKKTLTLMVIGIYCRR